MVYNFDIMPDEDHGHDVEESATDPELLDEKIEYVGQGHYACKDCENLVGPGEKGCECPTLENLDSTNIRQRIAVDVDGTLTQGDNRYWEEMCEPDHDAIDQVNELYNSGHTIIIWTARLWSNAPQLKAFLTRYGVKHHGIMMGKGSADLYVDNKAVNEEDFFDE